MCMTQFKTPQFISLREFLIGCWEIFPDMNKMTWVKPVPISHFQNWSKFFYGTSTRNAKLFIVVLLAIVSWRHASQIFRHHRRYFIKYAHSCFGFIYVGGGQWLGDYSVSFTNNWNYFHWLGLSNSETEFYMSLKHEKQSAPLSRWPTVSAEQCPKGGGMIAYHLTDWALGECCICRRPFCI